MNPNFLDRYHLLARLGQGGMSDVFLAVTLGQDNFRKLVVVKVLRNSLAVTPRYIEMFKDEARLSAHLNHPNVVQTYETGEANGYHYLAMEYLEGQSLAHVRERFHKQSDVPLPVALKIVHGALEGLYYAHTLSDYSGKPLGIVHRDATPQNIFVTYQGSVKVVDFGIAQASLMTTSHLPGRVNGKNAYMAPEQARGDQVDARADIYSMGVVLWELLAGERLWPGLVDVEWVANLQATMIPSPKSRRPSIPNAIADLCLSALSPDPTQRPRTAREFQREIENSLKSESDLPADRELGKLVASAFATDRCHAQAVIDRALKFALITSKRHDAGALPGSEEVPYLPIASSECISSVHDALTAVDTPRAVALNAALTEVSLRTGTPAAVERPIVPATTVKKPNSALQTWPLFAAILGAGLLAGSVSALLRGGNPPDRDRKQALANTPPILRPSELPRAASATTSKPLVELSGDVAEDFTLSSEFDYLLRDATRVLPGATLTIQKGTTLHGDIATKGILLVLPGGQLEATGTPDEPIVFTSNAPQGQRKAGDWGGVILLGKAPTNADNLAIEGLARRYEYGGADPNDSSGSLRYVRIEYTGQEVAPNNETNGLSLGGVGRGTTLDHILVRNTKDDCFEFFGGTVDAKYLACQNPGDDAFDWDYGYSGRLQYLVAQASPSTRSGSNGLEGDNDPSGSRAKPQSRPQIWNATLCGKGRNFAGEHNALLLRRGTAAQVNNSLFVGFATGLDVRDTGTAPDVRASTFWGNTMNNWARTEVKTSLDPELKDDDNFFDEASFLRAAPLDNREADPDLANCLHSTAPEFFPKGAAEKGRTPSRDGFLDHAGAFRGAMRGPNDNWLTGSWAEFGP